MDCRIKSGNDEIEGRSRGAAERPSYGSERIGKWRVANGKYRFAIRNSQFAKRPFRETGREEEKQGWRLPLRLR
jgi:hypothetical protein